MKRILFITSQYRAGERIYPIIPFLSKDYKLDLLKVYQMDSTKYKWVGDYDLRTHFDKTYLQYFDNEYNGNRSIKKINFKKYDLIISDDNRDSQKTNLMDIYSLKSCPLIACSHGNWNLDKTWHVKKSHKISFDKCFVFGKTEKLYDHCLLGGIPSNDTLKLYQNLEKKHILIIVNFLGNRKSPFPIVFNDKFIKELNLEKLQNIYNLPFIIKLKSRADELDYNRNVKYLRSILPKTLKYKIIVDTINDNKLVAESKFVISAPSTLTFKSIQLGIPTIIIKNSGQIGAFHNYDGVFNSTDNIIKYIDNYETKHDFIKNTIEGGIDFNSTKIMLNNIKKFL